MAKFRKIRQTIEDREYLYERTVENSAKWSSMTLEELKAEWLALGNTPALTTEDKAAALRYLWLSQMKRMIGN